MFLDSGMNDALKKFLGNLPNQSQNLYLGGLRGSSKSLLVSQLPRFNGRPVIVVADSFERAEQLQEDLHFFSGGEGLYFFPHWDTLPYDNFSPHRDIVSRRFQALKALHDKQVQFLITTPMALMQRMIPQSLFLRNCFELQCGKSIPRPFLLRRIGEAGYILVDVVEERGEYSVREEIVDLFPLNHQTPLRLEWEHESLSSIKVFDVQTQLSAGQPLESIAILPAQEILFSAEIHSHAQEMLEQAQRQNPSAVLEQTCALLQQKQYFSGIESLLGLFYQNPSSLFDYWDPRSLLVLDEPWKIKEKSRAVYDEIFTEYELSRQQNHYALKPEQSYLSHQDVELAFKKFLTLNLFESSKSLNHVHPFYDCSFLDNHSLRTDGRKAHQDSHSSVAHAIRKIKSWQQDGATVLFTARNQTHADHLKELLADFRVQGNGQALKNEKPGWEDWLKNGFKLPRDCAESPILTGPLSCGFRMANDRGKIEFALLTEEEIFGEKFRKRRLNRSKIQQVMGNLEDLEEGDYVVHLDYGVGRYRGLEKINVTGQSSDFMVLTYAREEKVYIPVDRFHLVQKYINADGSPPRLNKLGEKAWTKAKSKVAKAVAEMSHDLVEIYAARNAKQGFCYAPDNHLMTEFELAFPFEETEDQSIVIREVKADMESAYPMDRLVCGDVGFGKTEIAIRAAFKAVADSKQVGVLVPTTILAQQHFVSFRNRMDGMPVTIEVLSRFRTPAEQRQIIKRLACGTVDVLIGTHRMLSADIEFKDLGLLVVDEEQRFGVRHKEKIKKFRAEIDVLTLSATPIPRTLYMSMLGIRDLSLIHSPPPDRLSIRTRFVKSNAHIIQEAVSREIRRNGQVFIVHNRVETIYEYASFLEQILPDVGIAIAHGQLSENELEKIMMRFIEGEYEVLVSTTIIESGLDIPRANTIIVNNAHQFGLSQLYQLRGRVGRSNLQAYAYLLVPADGILSQVAEERLKILQELNELGSGFKIASRDLELRGAGNLLGSAQSGHIASVGMELYTQMIDDAVKKLKKQKESFPLEAIKISFDAQCHIPETYVRNSGQRLGLYKKLAAVRDEEALRNLRDETENRFGHLPDPLIDLFKSTQARLLGQRFAFKTIEHRNNQLQVQILKTDKLNTEKLIEWLQQPQTPLRFVPENTLILTNIPNSMNHILDGLQRFEKLFVSP